MSIRLAATLDPAAAPVASNASEIRSIRLDAHGPATRAPVDTSIERRDTLERELDRVQTSLVAERATYAQQMTWLMLSQALLLNAFLLLLIFGWSTPLPGKRLLLAGLAAFSAVVAILIVLALRGTRDAVMSLHQHRKQLEASLQKDFGRPPVFAPRALVTRGLAGFANGLLPVTIVAGWIAMTLYALAAPLGAGTAEASAAGATSPTTTRSAPRSSAPKQTAAAITPPAASSPAAPLHPDDEAAARGVLR